MRIWGGVAEEERERGVLVKSVVFGKGECVLEDCEGGGDVVIGREGGGRGCAGRMGERRVVRDVLRDASFKDREIVVI